MSGRWRIGIALLAIWATSGPLAHAAVKPVVTNKNRFRIPFRFDALSLQRMNARELQLFVSMNNGASWDLSQSLAPQSGKFEFHAPADGEYWFAVRTIDGAGVIHPPGPKIDAGLIVIVDSISPTLAVSLEQPAPGRVQLTWSASDANLDATTLRLEYQQAGQADWQPVSVVPTQRGSTTWSVAATGRVSVRGTISDLAGNNGQGQAELQAQGGGGKSGPVPDLRQPIADKDSTDQLSESPAPPMMVEPRTAAVPIRPAPGSAPAAEQNSLPGPTNATIAKSKTAVQTPLVTAAPEQRPEVMKGRWPADATVADNPLPTRINSRQRVVNTRRFQLGYKVDDVGPSGVGGVDLYITPDRGRQWYRYGEDADRTSPFDVEVPRDGDYGFTVRVRSGAGLALEPPIPGEPPSIQVIVDQTAPRIELLPVQQGQGAAMNQLTVRWKIHEDRPAEKPVSVYYAPALHGPWEPISGWQDDAGSFSWSVGPGSPAQFYVRVMARDAAGNVSQTDTTQPVVVDLSRPSARIVDVEVVPGSPR